MGLGPTIIVAAFPGDAPARLGGREGEGVLCVEAEFESLSLLATIPIRDGRICALCKRSGEENGVQEEVEQQGRSVARRHRTTSFT